jgi:hypothetical protein
MKYVTVAFAFLLAACLPGASDYDLSGTWAIEYHDDNGHEVDHPKLVLHQEGQKLNGVFGNKDWPIEGEIRANHMLFTYKGFASDGSSGLVHAQAWIQSPHKLVGRMMSPLNGGTFTATRE